MSREDAHLAERSWRFEQGYVIEKVRTGKKRYRTTRLHRAVMNPQPGQHVYFRDGNPRNCQRSNLTFDYINRPGKKTGRRPAFCPQH